MLTIIQEMIIKPGESVNYNVVLTWDNSTQNFGTKKNVVNIVETKNDAGYKEKDCRPELRQCEHHCSGRQDHSG